MKMNGKKRFLSWMIAFLMVFTYMPAMAYATETDNVDAAAPAAVSAGTEAELSVLDGQVLITNSTGTGALDGDIVTITAPGAFPLQPVPNEIKIYNKSGKTATLTFEYSAENYRDDREGGFSEKHDKGTYTILLDPEQHATMSITGKRTQQGDGTAVLTLKNFNLDYAAEVSKVKFDYAESLGSIAVAGETVESETVREIAYAQGALLEAFPAEGAEFLGWVNKDTRKILSTESSYMIKPINDIVVEALFSGADTKAYYLVGDEYFIDNFDEATAKATELERKTVVLMKSTVLSAGTYTIPAGVDFLVPFDKNNTMYTEPTMDLNMSVWGEYEKPTPFCTLTLAEGADLIVNGGLSLSARHYAANGGGRASGGPTGPVSFLVTEKNSEIIVGNGGSLYAYGYVIGEGTVTARKGATIYELFQVEDFRGGGATATVAINNMDKGVLPLTQYYVQNIEIPLTLEAGSMEYVYTSFFMSQASIGAAVPFIGDSNSMFHLSKGAITKKYDGTTDRLIVEADGNMSLSPITVEFSGSPLNSKMFDLAINSNISVQLNSGEVTINQDIAMLPGSEIFIEENATCTLAEGVNIYVYDADQWINYVGSNNTKFIPIYYAPGKKYDRTEADFVDAAVKVNGKLDATKGYVYTTFDRESGDGHSNIYSTGKGVVELAAGEQQHTYQFTQDGVLGEFHEIYLNPANLKHADGTYMQTIGGKYTYVDIAWQCDHKVVNEEVIEEPACEETGIKLVTCEKGDKYKALIPATGHTEVIDPAVEGNCTVDAKTEGSHCGVCGDVIVRQIVTPAPGHTEVVTKGKPATCTEEGKTDGIYCFVCDEVLAIQTVIDATGHDWVVEGIEPTCTTPGYGSSVCSACSEKVEDSIIPALGHDYEWATVKDPECEQPGIRAGKCSREDCGHETVQPTDPFGHNVKKVDELKATCSEKGHDEYWQCRICDGMFEQESCDVEFTNIPYVKELGHNPEKVNKVDATCTAAGNEAYWVCGICDVMFADEDCKTALSDITVIPAKGHEGVKVEAAEATCTETGNKAYWTCNGCDMLFGDEECKTVIADIPVISAKGHNAFKTEAVDATCTEDGNEAYWTCENCSMIFADKTCETALKEIPVIPATDHQLSMIEETGVTCTEDGNGTYWCCGNCDKLYADKNAETELAEIPLEKATGHKVSKVETKAETCTENGHDEYWICVACEAVFEDGECKTEYSSVPVIKATGHKSIKVEAKKASCTEPGNDEYWKCRNCEVAFADRDCEKVLDEIPVVGAAGHNTVKVEAVEENCTDDGNTEYWTCKTCESIFKNADCTVELTEVPVIKATGHNWNSEYTLDSAPSCTEYGSESIHCMSCDATKDHKQVQPVPHAWGEEKYQTPTVSKDGGWYKVCMDCSAVTWDNVQTYAQYVKAGVNATEVAAKTSASLKTETITVTWNKAGDSEITCYDIYRSKTGKAGSFGKIGQSNGLKYEDKTAKPGQTYYYKVRGVRTLDKSTYYTKWSNVPTAKVKKVTAAYVKESKMTIRSYYAGKGIKVTWTSPRVKVDGYEIWRSNKINGTYKKIKTTDTNARQWTNSGLKLQSRFYYKVRGYKMVNGKKVYTQFSAKGYRYVLNAANAKLANAIEKSDSITAKKAVKVNDGIKVTWSKDTDVKCTKYAIWRSTSKNGKYTKVATVKKAAYVNNLSYTDTKNLKAGKRYYYKVVGFRWFGNACPKTNASNVISAVR